jgi:hypothetical protein
MSTESDAVICAFCSYGTVAVGENTTYGWFVSSYMWWIYKYILRVKHHIIILTSGGRIDRVMWERNRETVTSG